MGAKGGIFPHTRSNFVFAPPVVLASSSRTRWILKVPHPVYPDKGRERFLRSAPFALRMLLRRVGIFLNSRLLSVIPPALSVLGEGRSHATRNLLVFFLAETSNFLCGLRWLSPAEIAPVCSSRLTWVRARFLTLMQEVQPRAANSPYLKSLSSLRAFCANLSAALGLSLFFWSAASRRRFAFRISLAVPFPQPPPFAFSPTSVHPFP